MADLRCPSCGRNNPDFLDNCQFCQTPLREDSTLHFGDSPVKKNTGELEPILPQWLKDVRQQARESAEENAAEEAAKPKVRNEPPDLLAGLASQAKDDREEVPDWLAGINPLTKPSAVESAKEEPVSDFFSQFEQNQPAPVFDLPVPQEDVPNWMTSSTTEQPHVEEKDELSDWFAKASAEESKPIEVESDQWGAVESGDVSPAMFKAPEPPKENEDLSWLHALEQTTKEPEQPSTPVADSAWSPAGETSSQDDLSWLNQLGSGSAFNVDEPAPSQPVESKPESTGEDLSWLNQLGGDTAFAPDESAPSQPVESKPESAREDLSWLNQLGDESEFTPNELPPAEPVASQTESPDEGLSWLNNFGDTSASTKDEPVADPALPSADLDWLSTLGTAEDVKAFEEKPAESNLDWLKGTTDQTLVNPSSEMISPFTKIPTGDLRGAESVPDWLKSATEQPEMPAPGALSDWFKDDDAAAHSPLQPVPIDPAFIPAPMDVPSLSNQDIDSLFSVDMPDWVGESKTDASDDAPAQPAAFASAFDDDSLAPVNLPSWVQAMRPVESVVSDEPSVESQPTEREGPLAGLRGVIPVAPVGSSRRPKAISLKLQASDEQQSAASILDQVLAGETNPRPIKSSAIILSQQRLRWALAGLFLFVLSAMIFLNTTFMPISASLPIPVSNASNAVVSLPPNSSVLVVVDYEPALAGEMEAVSGPLLDQLTLSSHPRLNFISTSANGSALVSRLLTNTGVGLPAPNGLDYKAGVDYFNLGFLPGGSSGVLEFVELPNAALPSASVNSISEFSAIIVLTDHAESGRVWIEQLDARKQVDPVLANQHLVVVASAQAGPLLEPYAASGQITGMVTGLSDAARYEYVNNSRPGIARRYWDSFGVGIFMAILLISLGGLWNLFSGIRIRRAEAELG